jgi:hypothetical protein
MSSYIQGNLGEPILLHVFLQRAFFSSTYFSMKYGSLQFTLEIIVRSEDPSENIQVGTLFLTVFPG